LNSQSKAAKTVAKVAAKAAPAKAAAKKATAVMEPMIRKIDSKVCVFFMLSSSSTNCFSGQVFSCLLSIAFFV
jgi:hypothetical protein